MALTSFIFCTPNTVPGQSQGKSQTTLTKAEIVDIVGTKRFPLEDVLAAVGLRKGDTATVNNLKDAIQYLQECGAFSEVAFSQDDTAQLRSSAGHAGQLVWHYLLWRS